MSNTATRDQHPSWIDDPDHGVVPIRKYADRRRKKIRIKWERVVVLVFLLVMSIGGLRVDVHGATRGVSDAGAVIFYLSLLFFFGILLENPLKKFVETKHR